MGRPSKAAERSEQILAATFRCISSYGLEGATLERIAVESGLSRSHVRHYLGNRDDILDKVRERLIDHYVTDTRRLVENTPPDRLPDAIVDYLFGPQWAPSEDNTVVEVLFEAAARDTRIRTSLHGYYTELERLISTSLRSSVTGATRGECTAVAYTLLCMAFGHSTFTELSFPDSRRSKVVDTARIVIAQLRDNAAARLAHDTIA